jgi:hypothetical protein
MNKGAVFVLAAITAFIGFRYGSSQMYDQQQVKLNKDGLTGDLALKCESNIADNQRYRNIYLNFDKQTVNYDNQYFTYTQHGLFIDKSTGGSVITLTSDKSFIEATFVGDFVRVHIDKNGKFFDNLDCQVERVR